MSYHLFLTMTINKFTWAAETVIIILKQPSSVIDIIFYILCISIFPWGASAVHHASGYTGKGMIPSLISSLIL